MECGDFANFITKDKKFLIFMPISNENNPSGEWEIDQYVTEFENPIIYMFNLETHKMKQSYILYDIEKNLEYLKFGKTLENISDLKFLGDIVISEGGTHSVLFVNKEK